MRHAKAFACILLVGALLLPTGCAGTRKDSVTGFYFDTVVTITVYGGEKDALSGALALCGTYENLLSKTREGSDVWNLNHADGARVAVSEDTRAILTLADDIARCTGGAFDVTVGPVVELWDFKSEHPALPDAGTLAAAAERVDYTKVDMNADGVRLPEGMSIDLGGIAKGYITDRVGQFLLEKGVSAAILNFGGNVLLLGQKPGGERWNIGIQDPDSKTGESIASLALTGGAVVTSGVYERGFTINGVRYHHLLNPKTGWPTENGLASVTILCADAATGDALSTACFVLGESKGMALIESLDGVEAVFVTASGEIISSPGVAADSLTALR